MHTIATSDRNELAVLAHECRESLASILLAVKCSRACPDDQKQHSGKCAKLSADRRNSWRK